MLSEQIIQDSFHSYLRSSLAQAKAERLLDVELLSSAESDLMITGPALCLYFAALRCTTHPPSVPLPKTTTGGGGPTDLSQDNCPPAFREFLSVWGRNVPQIQSLRPEGQHDLARVICNLPPLHDEISVSGIAADLRAVALAISQRRSFQDRYADALQAALDAGSGGPSPRRATFVPPPGYDPQNEPPTGSSNPPIVIIRETLYAALGETLSTRPGLRTELMTNPPRAYFSAVSLAILIVASSHVDVSSGAVRSAVGDKWLVLDECPEDLRRLMMELLEIARGIRDIEEEDSTLAVEKLSRGEEVPETTRMDRVKLILEKGVAYEERSSPQGRAVAFANRIGGLALGMTNLKTFKERQDEVFKILATVR